MTPERKTTNYYKEMRFVSLFGVALTVILVFLGYFILSLFTASVSFVLIMMTWRMNDNEKYKDIVFDTCTSITYQDGMNTVELTSCCRYPIIHGNTNCQNCNAKIIKDDED